jgi:predicted transcriptional regulator
MRLVDAPECGPASRFGDTHIYWVLSFLNEKDPIGRSKLSDLTGIGEGSIRNVIETLKKWQVINVKQTGMTLTESGRKLLDSIPMKLIQVEKSEYAIGAYQQGVLVKGVAGKIAKGTYKKERGMLAGANGAAVFMIKEGRLIMPKNWDMDTRDPKFARHLRDEGIEEGDAIIISGANDSRVATISAISIALDLL